MQTDPNLTIPSKLTNHAPKHGIKTAMGVNTSNVSLSTITEIAPLSEDIKPVADEHFISQLKAHGFYNQIFAKQLSYKPEKHVTGCFFF